MKKNEKLDDKIIEAVTAYVHKNYKQYEGKKLIVTLSESGRCYYVSDHKDESPLILGSTVI